MSTIDYKALAERVAQRAIYADNNADPNNKAWAADLRAVVSLLNGMADAQPVAWRCEVRDLLTQAEQCLSTAVQFAQWSHDEPPSYLSAWDYEADHIAAEIRAMLTAAPAAPQAEPTREPLSDERIAEEATNRQMTAACEDAFYDGVRWAEHSHEIGGNDAE